MIKRQRLAAAASKAGLVLAGLIAGLLLLELATRLLEPPYQGGEKIHQCNRLLGWTGPPNTSTVLETDGYRHNLSWNSEGFHDYDHPLKKEDGVFRIMVFGDSFIEASEVEIEQTSFYVLQETLNKSAPPGTRFEVISAGMRAWGPAQEFVYFRYRGQFYAPDLLLLFWLPANDLSDVLPYKRLTGSGFNCYWPYFAICDGQFDPEPWFPAPGTPPVWKKCSSTQKVLSGWLSYLYHSSRLYQQLEPIIMHGFRRIHFASEYTPWLDQAISDDEALEYAYQMTDELMVHLSQEAQQIGAKTALVIVPFNVAVQSDVEASYAQSLAQTVKAATGLGINSTLPNQLFSALIQRRNLPVLDLHPIFVEAARAGGEALYWPVDPHWTVAGNRLAGETVARWLIEQKLVPVAEK
jgi:hypothetical protein